ncbi:hypothetical protein D3C73_1320530 [compost metagenome]
MIPEIGQSGSITIEEDQDEMLPSLTYSVNLEQGRISGRVDGLDALRQAVDKALRTIRYEHLIYSSDYGTEWNLVLGRERLLARAELRRVVTEALLQDDRITEVTFSEIVFSGDQVEMYLTVHSRYGDIQMRKEVTANG